MTLEEITLILSKVKQKRYVLRRTVDFASSITKSYRKYIMELWEVCPEDLKKNKIIFSVNSLGLFAEEEQKKQLVNDTEQLFMEKLFKTMEENGI